MVEVSDLTAKFGVGRNLGFRGKFNLGTEVGRNCCDQQIMYGQPHIFCWHAHLLTGWDEALSCSCSNLPGFAEFVLLLTGRPVALW